MSQGKTSTNRMELGKALSKAATSQELREIAEAVLAEANAQHEREQRDAQPEREVIDLDDLAGKNVRAFRDSARFTQEQVAQLMNRFGFPWKRLTVSDVESFRRSISMKELVALASIFHQPVVNFLTPNSNEAVSVLGDSKSKDGNKILSGELASVLIGGEKHGTIGRHASLSDAINACRDFATNAPYELGGAVQPTYRGIAVSMPNAMTPPPALSAGAIQVQPTTVIFPPNSKDS